MLLTKFDQARPPELQCVREVRVGMSAERRADALRFYVDLLGLPPWPAEHQMPGGWGGGEPARGLLLQQRHDAPVDPVRRRLLVYVSSLERLEASLLEADWPYQRSHGLISGDDCIHVADPVGHRIEVRQIRDL